MGFVALKETRAQLVLWVNVVPQVKLALLDRWVTLAYVVHPVPRGHRGPPELPERLVWVATMAVQVNPVLRVRQDRRERRDPAERPDQRDPTARTGSKVHAAIRERMVNPALMGPLDRLGRVGSLGESDKTVYQDRQGTPASPAIKADEAQTVSVERLAFLELVASLVPKANVVLKVLMDLQELTAIRVLLVPEVSRATWQRRALSDLLVLTALRVRAVREDPRGRREKMEKMANPARLLKMVPQVPKVPVALQVSAVSRVPLVLKVYKELKEKLAKMDLWVPPEVPA